MNELIGRLLKESREEAGHHAIKNGNPQDLLFSYLWGEKFAEKIIKECIDVMDKTASDAEEKNTYMGDDVPTSVHQHKIRAHFGVE